MTASSYVARTYDRTVSTTPGQGFQEFYAILESWLGRSRQRADLTGLDEWRLRDVGISRVEQVNESGKRFWAA